MSKELITVTATDLVITPSKIDKVLGFEPGFTVPFAKISRISQGYGLKNEHGVWKSAGTSGLGKSVGTFYKGDITAYFNIRSNEKPILIEIPAGSGLPYRQLVLSVANPQAIFDEIKKVAPDLLKDISTKQNAVKESPIQSVSRTENKTMEQQAVNRRHFIINASVVLSVLLLIVAVLSLVFPALGSVAMLLGFLVGLLAVASVVLNLSYQRKLSRPKKM